MKGEQVPTIDYDKKVNIGPNSSKIFEEMPGYVGKSRVSKKSIMLDFELDDEFIDVW